MFVLLSLLACSEYGLDPQGVGAGLSDPGADANADGTLPDLPPGFGGSSGDDGLSGHGDSGGDGGGGDAGGDGGGDAGGDGGGDAGGDGGDDAGGDGGGDAGGDGGDDAGGDGGDPDHPPTHEYVPDDCSNGTGVDFTPGEIFVTSWTTPELEGSLTIAQAGSYELYNTSIAESGASQTNETGYITIPNSVNPDGNPRFGNCGDLWLAEDPDNNGPLPAGTARYLGTFDLDAGANTLVFHHYCPLYRAGICPSFHDDSNANTTCDSSSVNSVHFFPDHVCLVRVD